MSWKKYRELFETRDVDESQFILGVDIGNLTSAVAFYNAVSREPEIIDVSGGYGRASAPTSLSYIPDANEWVFGEYSALSAGSGDVAVSGLVEKLGNNEYCEIDAKPVSVTHLLAIYIKDLLSNCKNINPRAEIAGIVAAVPCYASEEATSELLSALREAGYERSVVALVSDQECLLTRFYFNRPVITENILIIDFGGREIRGGLYSVAPDGENAFVKRLSSVFDDKLSARAINDAAEGFFTSFYEKAAGTPRDKLDKRTLDNLSAFSYQHRDLLFQKNKTKPVKVYYNFAYQPFQQQITDSEIETLMRPFYNRFSLFLSDLLKKTTPGEFTKRDISAVICAGGGFEAFWARDEVKKAFPYSDIVLYKNPKGVIAEGACVIAAERMNALRAAAGRLTPNVRNFTITDPHQLKTDIGVMASFNASERFMPIIERNSLWWQRRAPKSFIVNEPVRGPVYVGLFTRNADFETSQIGKLVLDGLPERPAGTTRIKMAFEFTNLNKLRVTATDMGFGELFPAVDYKKTFEIML